MPSSRHPQPPPPPNNGHINDLQDVILVSIISLLPVRTLLSTSVLSRRWQTLWTQATRLDFDVRGVPTPSALFLDRILTAHQPHILPVCRIRDDPIVSTTSGSLHTLIPHLSRKGITNLSLNYYCWNDPYKILTIPTLQHVSIARYSFLNRQPPSPDCIHLRSLRLNNTKLQDQVLACLISSAPHLARLSLIYCGLPEHLHINSQTLTQLEIEFASSIKSLNIGTPALTTLKLNQLPHLTDAFINAPSLSILNTSSYYIGEEEEYVQRSPDSNTNMLIYLLKGPNQLVKRRYELPRNADVFARLHKLFISTNLSWRVDAMKLATVLDNCTRLQELSIINTACFKRPKPAFWAKEDPFYCLEHYLESLWVKGFTGRPLDMEFLRFILTKSLKLKRVVVSSRKFDALNDVEAMLPRVPDRDIITKLEK